LPDFKKEGSNLSQLFIKLWSILVAAVNDPKAGEVICVLDALDECEESDRYTIIETLSRFYRHSAGEGGKNATLKFLVTSRPYYDIERRFRQLTCQLPTVRLAGEQETESISKEISLVIKARVKDIGLELGLDDSMQSSLEGELLNVSHRTYLWLKLIFDVIRNRLDVTKRRLRGIIGTLPDTVDKAYEAILAKSTDRKRAETLLHIVVSAVRPLTLKEMNIALAIKEDSRSEEELDLEEEEQFRVTVRNLCGLFVSVIDSRIYLIHQTAKDFLVCGKDAILRPSRSNSSQVDWKHSLEPVESNFVLAKICISYLLFSIFGSDPLVVNSDWRKMKEATSQYTYKHGFFDYSAKYWSAHFTEAKVEKMAILESALELCNTQSMRFRTWFPVCWPNPKFYGYPRDATDLILGSFLGHELLVKLLLEKGAKLETQGEDGRTPLSWAVGQGHEAVVKLLLEKGAKLEAQDSDSRTPLSWAVGRGHEAVVKLLLEKGAKLEAQDRYGWTPLSWAVGRGHEVVVKLLLEKGAKLEAQDRYGRTPLSWAAEQGYEVVVKLLLEKGAKLEAQDKYSRTPLL
jgi:ankyrin repeat protein